MKRLIEKAREALSGSQGSSGQPTQASLGRASDAEQQKAVASTLDPAPLLPLRGLGGAGVSGAALLALLPRLAQSGMTSVRTWGVDQLTADFLDACQAHGIVVMAGIWVDTSMHGHSVHAHTSLSRHVLHDTGHAPGQRHSALHDFPQASAAARDVAAWAHHPAIACWLVGNECETRCASVAESSKLVEACAEAVKAADPHHRPVATVIADRPDTLIALARGLPRHVDILGINSYGGAATLASRLQTVGYHGPFMLLEYGGIGPFEVSSAPWGAPLEPSSTQQAAVTAQEFAGAVMSSTPPRLVQGAATEAYRNALRNPDTIDAQGIKGHCVGMDVVLARRAALRAALHACERLSSPVCLAALAFIAGTKPEGSLTWFSHSLPMALLGDVHGEGGNGPGMQHVQVEDKLWLLQQLWLPQPDLTHLCDPESLAYKLAAHRLPHALGLVAHIQGKAPSHPVAGAHGAWAQIAPGQAFVAALQLVPCIHAHEPPACRYNIHWSIRQDEPQSLHTTLAKSGIPGGELTSAIAGRDLPREWSRAFTTMDAEGLAPFAGLPGLAVHTDLTAPPRCGAYRLYAFVRLVNVGTGGKAPVQGIAYATLPILVV